MTEEIIIDVSNCPHKSDDDCMEVPICNKYGDLMGYQSCEAQTLCPYRSQKKIERLEQENEKLKKEVKQIGSDFIKKGDYARELEQKNNSLQAQVNNITVQSNNVITALEQENKELKTCIEMIENTEGQAHIEGVRLAKENKELLKYETHYLDKYIELRNSLEEIKHILEIHKDELEECLHNDIDGMIQNKINEVLQWQKK